MLKRSTIAGLLAIIWMCVIFSFSAQVSEESSETSIAFSYRVVSSAGTFFRLNLNDGEIRRISNAIEGYVRKAAHMTEYAILSILLFFWLERWQLIELKKGIIAIFLAMLYAASDEIHQLFVKGRSGSVRDVIIDSVGAVLGVLIMVGVKKCISFLFSRRKYRETGLS